MTEAQATTYIRNSLNNVQESKWLGKSLTTSEQQILGKIKSDPKNCYPEFDSVGNFNYTMQGYDISFYYNFVRTVLMCGGDISNYDPEIY